MGYVTAADKLALRGGHPVIDLVNTVAWRGDDARRVDNLGDYSDLVGWSRHAGVVSATEAHDLMRAMRSDSDSAERAVARAKRLREALHALWTDGMQAPLNTISAEYRTALQHRELRAIDDGIEWTDRQSTVCTPVDRLAVAAVDLLTQISRDRVKACGDVACGWLFLDSSHRRNRRWCSAADCGNRDRARRHYERARR
jgi:predicted RNA-binding Zn ribbon-like protein